MSHSSISRRRRAAARRSRPIPPVSGGGGYASPTRDERGDAASSPTQPHRDAFALRMQPSRLGALDDADGRRQPLPPLPSVHLAPLGSLMDTADDSPSASGRRAGTLTPVKPFARNDAEDAGYSADSDVEPLEESEPLFVHYNPQPATKPRGLFRRRSAFSLRERDWRTLAWIRRVRVVPAVGALVAILLIVGAFALVLASRAASSAGNGLLGTSIGGHSAPTQIVVVQAPQTTAPTTTVASPYQIGVWTSTYSPGTSGMIQIYVRVGENPTPVANVPVTIVLQLGQSSTPYGPTKTDSDGIAVFNAYYSGATVGQPMYVIATATINGQKVTGQTTFVAGDGSAANNNQSPIAHP